MLKLLLATVSPSNVNPNPRSNDNTNGENVGKNGSMLPNGSYSLMYTFMSLTLRLFNPLLSIRVGSMSEEIPVSIGTVEDVDIMRHREITSKAASAILLLMLKHFKTSRIHLSVQITSSVNIFICISKHC